MLLFFTATATSPMVVLWETQARTLERLMSCPVTIETVIVGGILNSFPSGLGISLVPVVIGLALDITIPGPLVLAQSATIRCA